MGGQTDIVVLEQSDCSTYFDFYAYIKGKKNKGLTAYINSQAAHIGQLIYHRMRKGWVVWYLLRSVAILHFVL